MIRSTIAFSAAMVIAASGLLVAPGAQAGENHAADAATPGRAAESLTVARRVLAGQASPRDPSPTLALREVWLAKDQLRGRERREAKTMLARPTDGPNDPNGFGYTVPEDPAVCNARLCVHHVASTNDAPPSAAWVTKTLAVMDSVWNTEVGSLGYHAPLSDGIRGGGRHFDVYLKNLGPQIYGYCAPEGGGGKRKSPGFCVLDNDFSAAEFPLNDPLSNLTVTAAHEFFHAIQFGYDAREDGWMLESTATWMEERVATAINDSRQYLKHGQLYRPRMPLDIYHPNGYQYGNWIFWEYLSKKFGVGIVKRAWKQAAKHHGRPYSIEVLTKLLRSKGGLTKLYAKFANANLSPQTAYREGREYRVPRVRTIALGRGKKTTQRVKVDHLASRSFAVRPRASLKRSWSLRVSVDGPDRFTSPAVAVLIHKKNGRTSQRSMRLDRRGDGTIRLPFDRRRITRISITLANVSTRYRCSTRNYFACRGTSRDDEQRFTLRARAMR